jgi:hypothetical protein
MTARRPDELIDAFLDEGRNDLPDRAFDAVRAEIHRTRQRVVIGPWREPHMSNLAKVALAAAAVVAVLFGASRLLPSASGPSGPGAIQPSPTPSQTATPSLAATPADSVAPSLALISPGPVCDGTDRTGPMEPGTYSAAQSADTPVPYTVEVPAGWTLTGGCGFGKHAGADGGPTQDEVLFSIWNVTHIFTDACHWNEGTGVISAGTTAADLTDALTAQRGNEASATTDVQVDGSAALRTKFTISPEVDPSTCTSGDVRLWPAAGPNFAGGFCCSPRNSVVDVRIAEVNGQRVVVLTEYQPNTSAQDLAELEAIVESIRFDKTAASPAP